MALPSISIIVATRNRAVLLKGLLESVSSLRYPHFEVLVVDDGSTDETAAVITQFQSSGLPVRYWYQPWRKMGAARNLALAHADGEYVAFTDDDCLVTPDWLTMVARSFESHPDALGVQGKTITNHSAMTPFTRQVEQLEGGQPYRTCNIAYRTDIVRQLGGFDEHLIRGEDVVLGARVQERGPIVFAPEAVVIHPPRPKEWANRTAWRTLLESELHFKRTYPEYGAVRSQTLSVQKAEHVLSRWVFLPIHRYWRRHYRYFRRHPFLYLRHVPLMVREKLALFSLLPSFYGSWRHVQPSGSTAATHRPPTMARLSAKPDYAPTVSVVVPTRNRAAYLPGLLAALEQQEYAPHEVIVVDDASEDGTARLLRAWTGSGHVALRIERSRGSYAARNYGWHAARGDIVAFTDDDCLPHPGWISGLVGALAHPETTGAQGVTLARSGEITPFTHQIEQTRLGAPYRTCNIAYRRNVLETVGGFDERLRWYADNILGLEVGQLGPIAFADMAVVDHPPRPREYRNREDWLARFAADAEHRRRLHDLHLEPRVPRGLLPVVLWVARPLLKQSYRHLRFLLEHPDRYRQDIIPMAREKIALLQALAVFWREPSTVRLEPMPLLPPLSATPSISVGVVTRGRAEELGAVMAALRNQRYQPREIIIVEQQPRTGATVPTFGSEVRVCTAPVGGLAAARQLVVKVAVGDIVAFTDDDCLPDEGWLEAVVSAFRTRPDWWGVQGRTEPAAGPIGAHTIRVGRPNPLYQTCNIAYRRTALERAGGFDTGFQGWFEDTALGARISALGSIGWAPRMLVRHRATPRRPLNRQDWQRLLEDEHRLAHLYPNFYRRVRGPNVPLVILVRWLLGSPLKTLFREWPRGRHDWRSYIFLLGSLVAERAQLVRALIDLTFQRTGA